MSYQPKHFKASEFLPKGYIDLSVMDDDILEVADQIRELLGVPCTINAAGRQYCGWRPQDCPIGAPKSMHKLGRAVDIHPIGMSAEDARKMILKACELGAIPKLGRMEADVSWVHADTGNRKDGKVYLFHA